MKNGASHFECHVTSDSEFYVATVSGRPTAPSRGRPQKIKAMYYVVYFLESQIDPRRHYIGYTANLKQRVQYHNQGLVIATKQWRPWKLIYAELYLNKKDATGREKFLKSGSGWKFLQKQLIHYFTKIT
ncbi:MAG: GIY-YIG nuclease family protein [Patescibacteria group bacterium]